MALKLGNLAVKAALFFFFLALSSCAPAGRFYLQYGTRLTESDLDRVLAENPLQPGENYKVVTLGNAQEISHHVVQIRGREASHIHKDHDLTVIVLRGRGYLMLEKRRLDLGESDVLFIPRGVVHYYVNTSGAASVALVIFSPAFDGKDTIPAETP